jgi:transmembrane sensor
MGGDKTVSASTAAENVRELAASWYDRVHRDRVTEETRKALDAWLAQSAGHRAAYQEIERTWSSLRSVAHDPQILALRHETALRLTRRKTLGVRPMSVALAAAVLLTLGVALLFAVRPNGGPAIFTAMLEVFRGHKEGQYVTATGERLVVNLEDGSQVTLDTETALTVGFTRAERWVRLSRGQALFEVAKDRTRPFIVEVHNRRLVAVGTSFDVRLDGEQVRVTMVEGTVRVERPAPTRSDRPSLANDARRNRPREPGNAAGSAVIAQVPSNTVVATITAGEQLVTDESSPDSIRPADAERTTSWRHGQIIFDNTRLADAVAELNRYSQVKLQLGDPALAELRLSGAFATGHPRLFLEALTTYFPIQATQSDEHFVLLKLRQ